MDGESLERVLAAVLERETGAGDEVRTVCEASTSDGPASAQRAPDVDAYRHLSVCDFDSPYGRHRTSIPRAAVTTEIARAQRIAVPA